jgi:hypothetical protein
MGTSSTISILNSDGTVEQISAHCDGQIYNTGAILLINYQDLQKIKNLIQLGNLYILKKDVTPSFGQNHSFKNQIKDVSIFNGRDRGEGEIQSTQFSSYKDYFYFGAGYQFNYLFDEKKNKWFFIDTNIEERRPLTSMVKKHIKNMTSDIKIDYIDYSEQLRKKRDYRKMQKEIPTKKTTVKKKINKI